MYNPLKVYFQRKKVRKLIEEYKCVTVGMSGFIDCIVPQNVNGFIFDLTKIGVFVTDISWWCHCTDDNRHKYGCPHGLGGPADDHYNGYFSEIEPIIEIVGGNDAAIEYINVGVKKEQWYSPCLVPGLWLSVDASYLKRGKQ